mmetsp:Transcript_55583/g.118224  ORF Transcript_55583/g.118224 Transcript_55583/m.118224 type:complete len:245 (+) Transcript_55583:1676-2410(+)
MILSSLACQHQPQPSDRHYCHVCSAMEIPPRAISPSDWRKILSSLGCQYKPRLQTQPRPSADLGCQSIFRACIGRVDSGSMGPHIHPLDFLRLQCWSTHLRLDHLASSSPHTRPQHPLTACHKRTFLATSPVPHAHRAFHSSLPHLLEARQQCRVGLSMEMPIFADWREILSLNDWRVNLSSDSCQAILSPNDWLEFHCPNDWRVIHSSDDWLEIPSEEDWQEILSPTDWPEIASPDDWLEIPS